jgi:uncharacterized protein YdeI (YjbR/CyaY-like superfamily)
LGQAGEKIRPLYGRKPPAEVMIKAENFAQVEVNSRQQLRIWLVANHTRKTSIWLVAYKKHVRDQYVSTQDILDELLCVGWIDGIRRKLDIDRTMQLISPRQTKHWALSYKQRAAKLIKPGQMLPAGFAAIAESKQNGLWHQMDDVDALIHPEDLTKAFAVNLPVKTYFDQVAPSYQRNILRWIKLAKTPETRAQRISKTIVAAAKHQKLPQM